MTPGKYNYTSDFARTYFGQGKVAGKEEGRVEGRAETVLRQLALRFGSLSDGTQLRIRKASIAELDGLAERVLSAGTLGEALGEVGKASADSLVTNETSCEAMG